MEGNRRITLLEPQPTGERDRNNQRIYGPPLPHPVWALREDKPSAGEGLVGPAVEGGAWEVRYTIRVESVPRKPTEDWSVVDEDGMTLQLEGVFEKTSGPRARRLILICDRTGSRRQGT